MFNFQNITNVNGFDYKCKKNALQNSYASCITELGQYIYVGTLRNALTSIECSKNCKLNTPPWIIKGSDNNAEIWRYKKDGSENWEMVYKAPATDNIRGFNSMITHCTSNSKTIYASCISTKIIILKSEDGLTWTKIDTSNILGTTAKCLLSFNEKLYLSSLLIGYNRNCPLLYASNDPSVCPFYPVIDTEDIYFDSSKNPIGRIENINSFNNKLYVSISTAKGCELWRSKDSNPKTNDWFQIGSNGFYDRANSIVIDSEVYKNHLYLSCAKIMPLCLLAPLGFDIVRIDRDDNVCVVIGGNPLIKIPNYDNDQKFISCFNSGFNSFFNVFAWQLKVYSDTLFVSTYDASTNIKLLRDNIIYNSEIYIHTIGYDKYNSLLKYYTEICDLLTYYNYPKGFDIYISKDGIHYKPITLNGLDSKNTYGGKSLFSSTNGLLYLGTANPYEGCEVWEINKDNYISDSNDSDIACYYNNLEKINFVLTKIYPKLINILNSNSCI